MVVQVFNNLLLFFLELQLPGAPAFSFLAADCCIDRYMLGCEVKWFQRCKDSLEIIIP
jgi:hypothetical protein